MLQAVVDALDDRENAFSTDIKEKVLAILNMRTGQLFGETRLGSKIYRAAAFLNPSMSLQCTMHPIESDPLLNHITFGRTSSFAKSRMPLFRVFVIHTFCGRLENI